MVSLPPRQSPLEAQPADHGARPSAMCWSCKGPTDDANTFCATCGAVQPPRPLDHFARLNLPADFDVDLAELDRRYFQHQRRLHPDRFVTRSTRERLLSQQQATAVNEAYETLKEPLARADYLVHLKGAGTLPEGCNLINDQELLMETMELREALAEAEGPDDVAALRERAADDIRACITALSDAFAADDLERACALVTRLKYLDKLADECRARQVRLSDGDI